MQKLKINSKFESGMALVFCLMAIMILSFVAVTLLKTQTFVSKVHNLFIAAEVSADATDFCLQAAFEHLKINATNNTLNTDPLSTVSLSATSKINAAFAKPLQSRFSDAKNILTKDICSITFIKEEPAAGVGGGEISINRNYGAINGVMVRYYRLRAIRDNGSEVIEYQTILGI
jgi:Tfp pilus assembly protein PilX